MKKCIILHGPPGVGKTTIGKILYQQLKKSALLDADELWRIHPFTVNEDSKRLVENNIRFVMDEFQNSPLVDTIVFLWVIPNFDLMNRVKAWFNDMDLEIITLICDEETLNRRRKKDNRSNQAILLSPYYEMDTTIIDTTTHTVNDTIQEILQEISHVIR